jgi:hypothetical protein
VDHIEDRLSNLKGKADVLEESDEEKNREGWMKNARPLGHY